MQLENKIALVTGSATGIGEAIARRLASEGACLMIHGRESERQAGETIARSLPDAAFQAGNLENPDDCVALIEVTVEHFGGIDILVNNAAVITRSNLATTTAEIFDYTMNVNVRAPFLLIQAAHPHFIKAGGGRVLNIGSVNVYCGEAILMVYAASKGALMTLTRNLADAHAREGIRINQINPGWVLSANEHALQMRAGKPADWHEHLPPNFAPSGRILKPEEIAHFALAFVAEAGGPVSGAVVELEQYPVIGRNPLK